ncbi:MAG: class SAM-dependent methyltransferase [Firmicutes bacterium]|nr:class SAM-dependent methyltransferase [Bacillota bacterium]
MTYERKCPICNSENKMQLYKQEFANIQRVTFLKDGYDVVNCEDCGFIFADHIPSQAKFEEYYTSMSKYEKNDCNDLDELQSPVLQERFSSRFDKIREYIDNDSDILEIGCATGTFLKVLKDKGFQNVKGIDPSPKCVEYMKKKHRIDAEVGVISKLQSNKKFDLIMLVGVLEHIVDLKNLIQVMSSLLKDHGVLYLELPDIMNFSTEKDMPFQEFSVEHVNFFSIESLKNLLSLQNLFLDKYYIEDKYFDCLTASCIHASFIKKANCQYEIKKDCLGKDAVKKYIVDSYKIHNKVNEVLIKMVETQEPVVVWGVGTHTLRMLEQSNLKKCNIVALVDSNPRYVNGTWKNLTIKSPICLKEYKYAVILLSTIRYKEEMIRKIRDEMKLQNKILFLY